MNEATIKLSKAMRPLAEGLAEAINEIAGEPIAFALLVFTEGRASYISNAKREDAIEELKKFLAHLESGTPDIPAHKVQ